MRVGKLAGIILLLLLTQASALTISYEITPEIVLPDGYADCIITLKAGSTAIEINSISFVSEAIEFEPSYIQHVGNLSPGGVYTLKVSMKSSKVGRQNAQMLVSTSGGTFSQSIELVIDDRFPEISLASPLYRGEVNYAKLLISTPILLKNLRVEALFNSTPRTFFTGELVGSTDFQFRLGEELDSLKFKISFYNGRSYHELEKTIKVDYLSSKGLVINLQPSKDVLFIGEAVNISVEITNLRSDEIYNVEVQLSGNGKFSQSTAKIDKIPSGGKKDFNFIFSPRERGIAEIGVKITYRDFFGTKYEKIENLTLSVLESYVLQIINIQKAPNVGKTKISGEVVNYGHRSALNTKISAFCDGDRADYYIGEIDAKDYETFDLEISCTNATLLLTWWNDAGENFLVSERLELEKLEQKEANPVPLYVGTVASALVIVFVLYLVYRARKK
ncbi:MAG: hypothetical protein NZ879_00870 [Archaeoglobaceae archaeon]|nr:hypothetical protein [Archaeoglobaceae archaeon]MDW8117519.1 hypothetical protein [Archaeoglobaceae archaeon]